MITIKAKQVGVFLSHKTFFFTCSTMGPLENFLLEKQWELLPHIFELRARGYNITTELFQISQPAMLLWQEIKPIYCPEPAWSVIKEQIIRNIQESHSCNLQGKQRTLYPLLALRKTFWRAESSQLIRQALFGPPVIYKYPCSWVD